MADATVNVIIEDKRSSKPKQKERNEVGAAMLFQYGQGMVLQFGLLAVGIYFGIREYNRVHNIKYSFHFENRVLMKLPSGTKNTDLMKDQDFLKRIRQNVLWGANLQDGLDIRDDVEGHKQVVVTEVTEVATVRAQRQLEDADASERQLSSLIDQAFDIRVRIDLEPKQFEKVISLHAMVHGIRKALAERLTETKYKNQNQDYAYIQGVKYFKRPSDEEDFATDEKEGKIKPKIKVIEDIPHVTNASRLSPSQLKTQMIAQKKKFEFTTKFATLTLENPFKSKEGEDKIEEDEHDELAHSDIKNKQKFCIPLCESLRISSTSDTPTARAQIPHYKCPSFDTDFWKKNKCSAQNEVCSNHSFHCQKKPQQASGVTATSCATNGLPDDSKCSSQKDAQWGFDARHCDLYSKTCVAGKRDWNDRRPKKVLRSLSEQ